MEQLASSHTEQPEYNQGAARTCRTSTRDRLALIESKLLTPKVFTSALSKPRCCSVLMTMSNCAPLTWVW